MKTIITIFCVICLITPALGAKGIDLAVAFNNFSCFKTAGYTYAIVRGYRSTGTIDTNGATTMKNA
jgi:hypothetical protein